jgi:tol-pal system protein YbgF
MRPYFRFTHTALSCAVAVLYAFSAPTQAGLLDDNDARKAILELRTEVRQRDAEQTAKNTQLGAASADGMLKLHQELAQQGKQAQQQAEAIDALKRTILDLNNALTQLKESQARLSGELEVLTNTQQTDSQEAKKQAQALQALQDLPSLRSQNAEYASKIAQLDARLKRLEPRVIAVDGQDSLVERGEEASFNAALAAFNATDYADASQGFTAFIAQYPRSELLGTAYFWLGNSRYANREPKSAIAALQTLLQKFPKHPRSADAMLTLAQSYDDANDKPRSQETYQAILSRYPNTAAAKTAQEALAVLAPLKKTVVPKAVTIKTVTTKTAPTPAAKPTGKAVKQ